MWVQKPFLVSLLVVEWDLALEYDLQFELECYNVLDVDFVSA